MSQYKLITKTDIPCWYHMALESGQGSPRLILAVHEGFAKSAMKISGTSPISEEARADFGLDDFSGDLESGWFGFNRSLTRSGSKGEFFIFQGPIPRVATLDDEPCDYCEGKNGKSVGQSCFFCDGKGRRTRFDFLAASALSASLSVFSKLAYYYQGNASSPFPQLINISPMAAVGEKGFSLWGQFSRIFRQWLCQKGANRFKKAEMSMKEAYCFMMDSSDKADGSEFRVQASGDGWLTMDCPGNGCGIYPADFEAGKDVGCRFESHNMDSPVQQITALAGLASLWSQCLPETDCL